MIRLPIQKLAASPVSPLKSQFKSELLHHGKDWQQDVNYLRDTYMEIYAIWEATQPFTYETDAEGNQQVSETNYDVEQDKQLYAKTEPLLRELILGLAGVSQQMTMRRDLYQATENAQHDFSTASSYAKATDFAMATLYQSYALAKMHKMLDSLTREVNSQSRRAGFADVVSNFSTDVVPGAIEIRYKEKPIGWIGFPMLEMFPALKNWLEKSQDKTSDNEWNSIVQRYAEPSLELAKAGSRKLAYGYDVSGEQGEGGGTSGNDTHLWDTGNSPKRNHTQNNPANMAMDAEAETDFPELGPMKHKHIYWPPRTR